MDEVRQIWGGKVMDGIESIDEDLEVYALFDGEPVELVQYGCDVADGRCFSDDTSSRILNQLELMEVFVGKAKQEGVTIIKARGY